MRWRDLEVGDTVIPTQSTTEFYYYPWIVLEIVGDRLTIFNVGDGRISAGWLDSTSFSKSVKVFRNGSLLFGKE
jgi:hypothetical protein